MTRIAMPRLGRTPVCRAMCVTVLLLGALAALNAPAYAEGVPHWDILTRTAPTKFANVGEEGVIVGTLANLGDTVLDAEANHVTITDVLPAGLEVFTPTNKEHKPIAKILVTVDPGETAPEAGQPLETKVLECNEATVEEKSVVTCGYEGELPPGIAISLLIHVKPKPVSGLSAGATLPTGTDLGENTIKIEGGDAATAEEHSLPIESGPSVPFGIERYELRPEDESGGVDANAGSHPFQLTTTLAFNQTFSENPNEAGAGNPAPSTPELLQNVSTTLPPGLIGNTNYGEECSDVVFNDVHEGNFNECPGRTAAGVAIVTFRNPGFEALHYQTETLPVFFLKPETGEPARLGFEFENVPVVLDTSVLTGKSYAVDVASKYTSTSAEVMSVILAVWGTPAAEAHNEARGWECLGHGFRLVRNLGRKGTPPCEPSGEKNPFPYLTLPTTCEKPLESTVNVTSWDAGEMPPPTTAMLNSVQLTGCAGLPFNPTFSMEPTQHEASTPTGFRIEVKIPQAPTLVPSEADLSVAENNAQETQVVFPAGVLSNAGFANGLTEACPASAAGFEGNEESEGSFGEQLENDKFSAAVLGCPEVSKIGTVKIVTPYLKEAEREPLEGSVYLAKQHTDPFKPELITYLTAENKSSGIRVKLAGETKILAAGEQLPGGRVATEGQLLSTFRDTPPVPFETLEINLPNGPRAASTTPAHCGTAESSANFTSYSGEAGSAPSVVPAPSSFQITSGPGGSPCPGANLPFSPGFEAGSTNTQAGAFTGFKLKIQRPDGEQALKSIAMETPPGLAAVLGSVPLCGEPQAAEGNCSEESKIGESRTLSGLGGSPVSLPGEVYLTGPYQRAPFGLSSVTEVKTGPFDLGRIVIRSAINVNPTTAQAIITTSEGEFFPLLGNPGQAQFGAPQATGGLPEFVEHLPAQVKELEVQINRPSFEFNPTSCGELKTTGTLVGGEGSSDSVSSPFFASNCASLPFQPTLTATVGAQGSKFKGTSLKVKVESAGLGQANIRKVDLTLPSVLPSRESTIEKACLAATFEANPANCDEGSVIGEGVVDTPVFKNPLRGPAYLVSHGAEAFPAVEFVLQGEGVKVILEGKTDIKSGITYSKFEDSPDAPFTKFESIFPEGPHSVLTVFVPENENYNLCKHTSQLILPMTMVAQNGAVIERTVQIGTEGCGGVKGNKVTKLSKAQRLAKALKACKKDKKKSKRVACEKTARKKYGSHAKKSSKKHKSSKK
jgi:hypothetical protein